ENSDSILIDVKGKQIIDPNESSLDYQMTFESEEDLIEINLEGTSEEADGYNDDVSLNVVSDADMMNVQINYFAEETSEGGETDFDRTFTLSENDMEIAKLHWDGQNNYEKDQREANNSIALETKGLARDLLVLHLDVVGEQVKEVEAADPEEGKDLGKMSGEEVIDYFETDVTSQFTKWLMLQMQQFQ